MFRRGEFWIVAALPIAIALVSCGGGGGSSSSSSSSSGGGSTTSSSSSGGSSTSSSSSSSGGGSTSSSSSGGPVVTVSLGTAQWTIDGNTRQESVYYTAQDTKQTGTPLINIFTYTGTVAGGNFSPGTVYLGFAPPTSVPTTYTIADGATLPFGSCRDDSDWPYDNHKYQAQAGGTITVTQYGGGACAGVFSLTLKETNGTKTHTITNGQFNAKEGISAHD